MDSDVHASDLQRRVKVVFMNCLGFYVIKYWQTIGHRSKGFISVGITQGIIKVVELSGISGVIPW